MLILHTYLRCARTQQLFSMGLIVQKKHLSTRLLKDYHTSYIYHIYDGNTSDEWNRYISDGRRVSMTQNT